MSARPHRSVRLRSRDVEAAAPDQRRVRRSPAGVVARRHAHRLRDRSLLERSLDARHRILPPRAHRPRQRRHRGGARLHQRQEHQPAMDARQPRAVFHLGPRRHPERLPRGDRHGRRNRLTQITRVRTGISGITGSSPALSVATKSGTAAFSLYDGRQARHLRHRARRCAGRPRPFGAGGLGGRAAAARPEAERRAGRSSRTRPSGCRRSRRPRFRASRTSRR